MEFVKRGTKIICIGRNYAKHAKELGNEIPTLPFWFIKPTTCYVESGGEIIYPKITNNLHHELELGVIIGKKMSQVAKDNVMDYVAGYSITNDVTCRDLQEQCKKERKPWDISKCLDTFCAVGPFIPADKLEHNNVEMKLTVNGEVRQHANTKDMLFDVPTLLEYVNQHVTLMPGDMIQTGTPEGVGPMEVGDTVTISIPGVSEASFKVVADPIDFVRHGTKIVCIGRNYAKHAKELGNEIPTLPFWFIKPTTCYVESGGEIIFPKISKNLHHELELGVIIGRKMSKVAKDDVMDYVAGFCITNDVTCRDLQEQCKEERKPWSVSKCLDTHCAVGSFISAEKLEHNNVEMKLTVNGEVRQHANTKDMLFDVPTLLEYVNQHVTLMPGDMIQTGTPEGVGPMEVGDTVTMSIPGVSEASFKIV